MTVNNNYAKEAEARWPNEYRASTLKLSSMSKVDQEKVFAQGSENIEKIAAAFINKFDAASSRVQALVNEHFKWVCNFWLPNKDAYIGLGKMYVEDPRFTQNYDKYAKGCAEFMAKAMQIYAQENLAN